MSSDDLTALLQEAKDLLADGHRRAAVRLFLQVCKDAIARIENETEWNSPNGNVVVSYPWEARRLADDASEALHSVVLALSMEPGPATIPEEDDNDRVPAPLSLDDLVVGGSGASDGSPTVDEELEPIESMEEQPPYQSGHPLPRIPLSPLSRSLILATDQAEEAQLRFDAARLANPNMNSSALRRLIEDVSICRDRVSGLEKTISRMAGPEYSIESFDPDFLAKQLAIIELGFLRTIIDKLDARDPPARLENLLVGGAVAPQSTGLEDLRIALDWSRYLVHIIVESVISAQPDRTAAAKGNGSFTPAHARARIITHLLATSQILLRTYKCHSSTAAIIVALSGPEIRRLRSSWALVEPRGREYLERVRPIFVSNDREEENGWHEYATEVEAELLQWHAAGDAPGIAVSPWWHPVLVSLESIISHHATVHPQGDPEKLALTEKGTRLAARWTALMELAVGTFDGNRAMVEEVLGTLPESELLRGNKPRSLEEMVPRNSQADEPFQHWLLTRAFYTRRELWKLSLGCERLVGRLGPGREWEGFWYPAQILAEDGVKLEGREEIAGAEHQSGGLLPDEEEAASLLSEHGSNLPVEPILVGGDSVPEHQSSSNNSDSEPTGSDENDVVGAVDDPADAAADRGEYASLHSVDDANIVVDDKSGEHVSRVLESPDLEVNAETNEAELDAVEEGEDAGNEPSIPNEGALTAEEQAELDRELDELEREMDEVDDPDAHLATGSPSFASVNDNPWHETYSTPAGTPELPAPGVEDDLWAPAQTETGETRDEAPTESNGQIPEEKGHIETFEDGLADIRADEEAGLYEAEVERGASFEEEGRQMKDADGTVLKEQETVMSDFARDEEQLAKDAEDEPSQLDGLESDSQINAILPMDEAVPEAFAEQNDLVPAIQQSSISDVDEQPDEDSPLVGNDGGSAADVEVDISRSAPDSQDTDRHDEDSLDEPALEDDGVQDHEQVQSTSPQNSSLQFDDASLDFLARASEPLFIPTTPHIESIAPPLPPKPPGLQRSPVLPPPLHEALPPPPPRDPLLPAGWVERDPLFPPPSAPDFEPPASDQEEVDELLKDMSIAASGAEPRQQFGNLWDRLAFLSPPKSDHV